jgi:hypothetical protein
MKTYAWCAFAVAASLTMAGPTRAEEIRGNVGLVAVAFESAPLPTASVPLPPRRSTVTAPARPAAPVPSATVAVRTSGRCVDLRCPSMIIFGAAY